MMRAQLFQKHFQLVQDLTTKGNQVVRQVAKTHGMAPTEDSQIQAFWADFIAQETPSNSATYFAALNLSNGQV